MDKKRYIYLFYDWNWLYETHDVIALFSSFKTAVDIIDKEYPDLPKQFDWFCPWGEFIEGRERWIISETKVRQFYICKEELR